MSKEAMKLALETAEGILNADWRKWDELASPAEFERWAKSRANFMATILREALAKPDFWEGYVPEPDKRQQALDKKAENARELGLDYEPAQQEPVGWLDSNDKLAEFMHKDLKAEHDKRDSSTPRAFQIPVYTTPPQRTWVGLTDEEADGLVQRFARYELLRAIETTLRSKNEDRS